MSTTRPGDDPTPRAGEGGAYRKTPTQLATDPAFTNTYASLHLLAGAAGATGPLVAKLRRNVESASVLVMGDSTGNETTEWVYLTFAALAARFPAYTVNYYLWDATGGTAYSSVVTIRTGTGSNVLNVYNASVAGTTLSYLQGARFTAAVITPGPFDLVICSHGHNTGDPGTTELTKLAARNGYLCVLDEVHAINPRARFLLIAQNPSFIAGRENWQGVKAGVLADIASQRGWGFLDVHQAFADKAVQMGATAFQAAYMADTTHPNSLGQSALWFPAVDAAFQAETASPIGGQAPPAIWQAPGKNLLGAYFDFSAWASTFPDNWALTGATATKDTTFFETGTYSCRLDAPASAGTMKLEYGYSLATLGMPYLKGQVVTFAARVYVPAGATTPSITLQDGTGAGTQARSDFGSTADQQGRWMWVYGTKRFSTSATFVILDLFPRISGSSASTIYVDRVYLTVGEMPRCGG